MRTFLLVFAFVSIAPAQLTLQQVVDQASSRYPAVQASLERVTAAAAGIQLTRAGYLPRADFLAQLNRATHNNG